MGNKEEKLQPRMRFRGFTDAWEKRKLGEVADKVTEKNKTGEYTEVLTNSAEYGIISQSDFFDKEIANVKNIGGYYVVEPDDFVYNPRISNSAPVGPVKRNKLKRIGIMSPLYFVLRPHDIDQGYLEYYFSTKKWHRFMALNGDTGARSDRFAIKDAVFVTMPIPFPNIKEQTKIGTFFAHLDNLIAVNQRKVENLRQLKTGLLQKMFVSEGSEIPEIRFAGFTDAWEKRKLGELNDVRDGTHDSPKYVVNGHPFVTSKNLSDQGLDLSDVSYISDEDFAAFNKRSKVDVGDILFGMIGTIGHPVLVESDSFAIKNVALIKGGGKISNCYLLQLLKSPVFDRYVKRENTGGTQKFLGLNLVRDFVLRVPNDDEQRKIGTFFAYLDNLIAVNQRKVELLQKLKKGYLQNLFA
jgi:type I restriction enzyme S subunit